MAMIRVIERSKLGSGNRIAQKLSNGTVIKFGCPESSRTGGQSLIEASLWNRYKNHAGVDECLVPVLDSAADGSWLIMPLVRPLERNMQGMSWREIDDLIDGLKHRLRKYRINAVDTLDLHIGNVGFLPNGTLVALDYGFKNDKFDTKERLCNGCTWSRLYFDRTVRHRGPSERE